MATADLGHLELHRFNRKAQGAVDHSFVWDFPGWAGDGVNVGVIDVNFTQHEDLQKVDVVAGSEHAETTSDHGTFVSGIIAAKHNSSGFLGIAPNATLLGAIGRADRTLETHKHLRKMADILNPGDIICMALQRAGPLFASGQGELGTKGAIPLEWWQEEYDAIKYATDRGIIVVTGAGNGDGSLDDVAYNTAYTGAPAHWKNAFDRTVRDSGSILVGGASPGKPRTTDWGTLASRLGYSNYGKCVDVCSWGREVTVIKSFRNGTGELGYWYYTNGGGTSVSTPIVAACLASVQGALKAAGKTLLTPATARAMLRATGLPQVDGTHPATQRIGSMVNLRDLYEYVGLSAVAITSPTPTQPESETITRPFLTINGVRIPLELGSARRVNNRDKTERALSGSPLTSRFKTKESFSFKTLPMDAAEMASVNGLFLGKGEGCDYRLGDLYTAKGLRDISGASYASNHGYHYGRFLNPGVHPVYRVPNMDNEFAGTFYMAFHSPVGSTAAALGTLAMFYGTPTDNTYTSFTPYSEIQVTSTHVRFQVAGESASITNPFIELPVSVLRTGRVNVVAVSWGPNGPTAMAVNGERAFNSMTNPNWIPYVPYVALGERWGVATRGSWTNGSRPLNWKVGQWGVWPFQVLDDDLARMSFGVLNANHGSPPPYLKAGGLMINANGDKPIICEGRVAGIEYQHSNQIALTLEMDEV